MNFDHNGYPKVNGATDWEDSSHLAGILTITEHPDEVNCTKYITNKQLYESPRTVDGKIRYIRCIGSKYNFSRDQAWLLMVALFKQGNKFSVRTEYIDGKDFIPPSLKGIETIAKRGRPYFWQRWWAIMEVWIHAKFQPLEEPFQTIATCEAYDLYKFWTSRNDKWKWSIRRYLSQLDGAWRGEPELAEHVIKYIERRTT